ncbi:MAG: hypothetical protein AAB225_06905 [Acidobacteriota bacterium]
MRTRYIALLGLLALSLAFAQSKPDLTGSWKVDNSKSNFGALPPPQSLVNKIDHKDPTLKITSITVGDSGERTFELAFTTDGKENTNSIGSIEIKSKVRWEGRDLLMEHTAGEVTLKDKWTLSEDGKTLTLVRQWSGSQGETTQTLVSEKQ